MPRKILLVSVFAFAAAFAAPAIAQDDLLGGARAEYVVAQADGDRAHIIERERNEAAADPIRALVYSPEFIFANRRVISLSDRQRDTMIADLQGLQSRLIGQQMEMEDAREALIAAMRAQPANEARVLAALDDVLNIEREVKRSQMQTLLRLRDSLTSAQRVRLSELRGLN